MEAREGAGRDIFERLCVLRACYPYRSDYDARSTLSVNEAIAYGEQLLRIVHLRERWSGGFGTYRAA
jgi:hypothetical protein